MDIPIEAAAAAIPADRTTYYTAIELAQLLNVSVKTVNHWRTSGRIPPGLKISNKVVRWTPAEVAAILGTGRED